MFRWESEGVVPGRRGKPASASTLTLESVWLSKGRKTQVSPHGRETASELGHIDSSWGGAAGGSRWEAKRNVEGTTRTRHSCQRVREVRKRMAAQNTARIYVCVCGGEFTRFFFTSCSSTNWRFTLVAFPRLGSFSLSIVFFASCTNVGLSKRGNSAVQGHPGETFCSPEDLSKDVGLFIWGGTSWQWTQHAVLLAAPGGRASSCASFGSFSMKRLQESFSTYGPSFGGVWIQTFHLGLSEGKLPSRYANILFFKATQTWLNWFLSSPPVPVPPVVRQSKGFPCCSQKSLHLFWLSIPSQALAVGGTPQARLQEQQSPAAPGHWAFPRDAERKRCSVLVLSQPCTGGVRVEQKLGARCGI